MIKISVVTCASLQVPYTGPELTPRVGCWCGVAARATCPSVVLEWVGLVGVCMFILYMVSANATLGELTTWTN